MVLLQKVGQIFQKVVVSTGCCAFLALASQGAFADEIGDFLFSQEVQSAEISPQNDALQTLLNYMHNEDEGQDLLHFTDEKEPFAPILRSGAVLVADADTGEVLYNKNENIPMPIASISKLMSAMVMLDAAQNMNELIEITEADIDRLKNSGSRLTVGTRLSRQKLLLLGLMSSENRAIHALSRHYPGGKSALLLAMNAKAQALGMSQSRFYDPTGLDARNQSTAIDLAYLVQAAYQYPLIRSYSTAQGTTVKNNRGRNLRYKNSNALVREGEWNIGLQKTGYIREAGRCMVLRTTVSGRAVIMVLLDAPSSYSRVADARAVKEWVSEQSL